MRYEEDEPRYDEEGRDAGTASRGQRNAGDSEVLDMLQTFWGCSGLIGILFNCIYIHGMYYSIHHIQKLRVNSICLELLPT